LPETAGPTMNTPKSLSSLAEGTKGIVAEIRIPVEHRARLLEMGLLVGTPIELIRFAPFGDPIEIKVRGYHLSLRRHEAEMVMIRPGT
jgi:ferrous iron transport protein A